MSDDLFVGFDWQRAPWDNPLLFTEAASFGPVGTTPEAWSLETNILQANLRVLEAQVAASGAGRIGQATAYSQLVNLIREYYLPAISVVNTQIRQHPGGGFYAVPHPTLGWPTLRGVTVSPTSLPASKARLARGLATLVLRASQDLAAGLPGPGNILPGGFDVLEDIGEPAGPTDITIGFDTPFKFGAAPKAGSGGAEGPPETRSANDDGRDRGARPTTEQTPSTTPGSPTPTQTASGPAKPPEGGSSVTSTVVSVEQLAGGGTKTVEVLRTPSGATSTKTTWRDADGKVTGVQDGPGPEQASASEGEQTTEGTGQGGDGDGESVDHINSGEGNPGGMTDPDSPGASEGSPRRIALPIVPSLLDKFSRAMADLARSGGSWGSPLGPTDGPSWGLGRAVGYGDPGSSSGGTSNGGGGDYFGGVQGGMGGSTLRPRPTPIERIRAGLDFGHLNNLPGDPPPVDLRTAQMHTVDDDGAAGSINSSAHQMYLQRVAPIARVSARRRG